MTKPTTRARAARGGALAVALSVGLVCANPQAALAHDAVIGGNPADGAVVEAFPGELTLEFSGHVQEGFNTFALTHAGSSEVVYSGEPTVEGQFVTLDLPDDVAAKLADQPGDYTIGYQIVSSDGHATKGMTSFTYEPASAGAQASETAAGQQSPAPADHAAEQKENSSTATWVWVLAGVAAVLVLGGVAVAAMGRRKAAAAQSPAERDETN
ncbi:copper resistance CopC family protein [Corynebacterium liangguodongii]|uniref:Copper resistance protein CopC n=1 Tax=Corynebacterium liangguodongii TaxID=2079535 RepID=A0A2S0WEP8_9CORY|nr:copper resistance CopC family protein [Corynebacterium liangguodongii]AWB84132.1 copper resistance protein CopC [Corynebacterium liangguodongii]PWC00143.1 copper resistance protein CopC [Corynebacterium liangguodongii]